MLDRVHRHPNVAAALGQALAEQISLFVVSTLQSAHA